MSGGVDGDGVVFRVADEGPGPPPAFVPHAFERFSRADDARGPATARGLGLALVDAVARAHGGTASRRRERVLRSGSLGSSRRESGSEPQTPIRLGA